MLDSIKAGQHVECTLKRDLNPDTANFKTVQRLMRLDPDNRKALRKAQEHRARTLVVRSRGKRPWPVRQRAAKVAVPREGATWKLVYVPQLHDDMKAVANVVDYKTA